MNSKEIEEKKKEMSKILKERNDETRLEDLKVLATLIGSSITRIESVPIGEKGGKYFTEQQNVITETEIVHNIQESLQTYVMIDMSKTASRNFWIALTSAIIALLAMLAAWAAVIVNFKYVD